MSSSLAKSTEFGAKGQGMPSSQLPQASQQHQSQKLPSGQKSQKLRLSCDACAAAKVKCSKERPRCERCNASDLSCVYGPSMKHGKSEKRRKQSDPHSPRSSLPSASAPKSQGFSSPVDQTFYNDLHQSYSDILQNIGDSNSVSTYPWNLNSSNAIPGNVFTAPSPESSFPPFGDRFWPARITSGRDGSGSLSPPKHDLNSTLGPLDTSASMLSSLDFSQQFISPGTLHPISSPSNSTSLSGLGGPDSISHTRHNISGVHDCYVIATSTLASLHFRSQSLFGDGSNSLSSLYSNPPSALPTSAPTIQTLDDVLRSNQEAISSVFQMLKCSCAEDPHMAMLYASIIVKVLYWHQVAAGTKNPSSRSIPTSEGLPSPADSSASMSSRNSPCLSSAPFISSEPIKIGTYTPDEEDQEPIRRLFLLSNLKKTGRLIEAFATVGEGVDARTSNLYASLASWLRSELSRSIKEVGNGVKASIAQ